MRPWLISIGSAALLAIVIWSLRRRCAHPHPLGLLPPVPNQDGSRTPAQWFCGECGKSWPTELNQSPQLVRRFDGYDQSKAAGAAKRASALEVSARRSAIIRSGLGKTKARAHGPAEIVPIRQRGGRA